MIAAVPLQMAVWRSRGEGASALLIMRHESVTGSYRPPSPRTVVPSVPPQTIISVPVHVAVWPDRGNGPIRVGVQESLVGEYRPPVSSTDVPSRPPQTIISSPVQTAV